MSRLVVEFDSVVTNGGRADVEDWDFSYGDEERVRVVLDGLFEMEFELPEDYLIRTFMVVELKLISSEISEEELTVNPCPYTKLYLDQFDCDFVRRCLFENNCVGVV